jgi:hypothetical protein
MHGRSSNLWRCVMSVHEKFDFQPIYKYKTDHTIVKQKNDLWWLYKCGFAFAKNGLVKI